MSTNINANMNVNMNTHINANINANTNINNTTTTNWFHPLDSFFAQPNNQGTNAGNTSIYQFAGGMANNNMTLGISPQAIGDLASQVAPEYPAMPMDLNPMERGTSIGNGAMYQFTGGMMNNGMSLGMTNEGMPLAMTNDGLSMTNNGMPLATTNNRMSSGMSSQATGDLASQIALGDSTMPLALDPMEGCTSAGNGSMYQFIGGMANDNISSSMAV